MNVLSFLFAAIGIPASILRLHSPTNFAAEFDKTPGRSSVHHGGKLHARARECREEERISCTSPVCRKTEEGEVVCTLPVSWGVRPVGSVGADTKGLALCVCWRVLLGCVLSRAFEIMRPLRAQRWLTLFFLPLRRRFRSVVLFPCSFSAAAAAAATTGCDSWLEGGKGHEARQDVDAQGGVKSRQGDHHGSAALGAVQEGDQRKRRTYLHTFPQRTFGL